MKIQSYTKLSTQGSTTLLEEEYAKCSNLAIVLDEAHALRWTGSRPSSRAYRFERFALAYPHVPIIVLTATPVDESLAQFARMSRYCLLCLSSLPYPDSKEADALGRIFATGDAAPYTGDWNLFRSLSSDTASLDQRRQDIGQFFIRTAFTRAGTVTRFQAFQETRLVVHHLDDLPIPTRCEDAVAAFDAGVLVPTGEPQLTPSAVARAQRKAITGFYYEWKWKDDNVDLPWLYARREWSKAVLAELRDNHAPGYDSEALVSTRIGQELANTTVTKRLSPLQQHWLEWQQQKAKLAPDIETIWLDTYLVDYCIRLARALNALLWYSSRALLQYLPRHIETIAPGEPVTGGRRPLAISLNSHYEGINLQDRWRAMVYAEIPGNAIRFDQSIGRIYRSGQKHDVHVFVPQHHESYLTPLARAREQAQLLATQQGFDNSLLSAVHVKERAFQWLNATERNLIIPG
jgi:hypothetical protein